MATPAFLYGCVMVMGAIGATLRYLLSEVLPEVPIPFGTLAINLFGCYVIYIIYRWFGRRTHLPHAVVRGMGVGLVGAFTTLSAFSTESLTFLQNGQYGLFTLYFALTMVGTFIASLLGWATVAYLLRRKKRQLEVRLREDNARIRAQRRNHGRRGTGGSR